MNNPPTSSTRSERRRSRRRQRLVDAAREIIARKGLAGLTVQDVTEEADMAVGSFYTYFPNKEALIEAAIWEDLQQLGNPHRPELKGLTLDQRLHAQLMQLFRFVEQHRALFQAVFGPRHAAEHYERALDLLETRVADGLRLNTELPEKAIAWIAPLLGGLIAGAIRYLLRHPDVDAQEMAARTAALIRPISEHIPTDPPNHQPPSPLISGSLNTEH
ncbi:MAG TPA: TetR/AcrR family transcriptional regulator [Anaerolineae bacterium]|nr:TetR/AcrR family transcriptional regulator [Anaerolineae bacterium]